jgi:biopolymer transport protein ExbD
VTFNQIESKLLAETKRLGDNSVVVRIPFDAQVQELVDVLRIGMENDLKMIIATKSDS